MIRSGFPREATVDGPRGTDLSECGWSTEAACGMDTDMDTRLHVERSDASHISGWAEGDPPRIAVFIDEVPAGHATAGDTRGDVNAHFGRHDRVFRQFRFDFRDDDLKPGLNAVRLELVADGGTDALTLDIHHAVSWPGYCHACEQDASFRAGSTWYRDTLLCEACGSSVRERALARVLTRLRPAWRELAIHESSPSPHGFSARLAASCPNYVGSHFRPALPLGRVQDGFRNENLERQTFPDARFDVVVSLDVMEHVLDPGAVYAEIHRTLRRGGIYVHTFPIRKWLVAPITPRVRLREDGSLEHLAEPEFHGNPIDPEGGSIVTHDYGYDIHQRIAAWAPFDVEIARFASRRLGLLGEYTEVVVCTKA